MSKFLSKDLGYTIEDVEMIAAENDKKAIGCTEEVSEQASQLNKKVDALMARMIAMTDFEKGAAGSSGGGPLGSIPEEENN